MHGGPSLTQNVAGLAEKPPSPFLAAPVGVRGQI